MRSINTSSNFFSNKFIQINNVSKIHNEKEEQVDSDKVEKIGKDKKEKVDNDK